MAQFYAAKRALIRKNKNKKKPSFQSENQEETELSVNGRGPLQVHHYTQYSPDSSMLSPFLPQPTRTYIVIHCFHRSIC